MEMPFAQPPLSARFTQLACFLLTEFSYWIAQPKSHPLFLLTTRFGVGEKGVRRPLDRGRYGCCQPPPGTDPYVMHDCLWLLPRVGRETVLVDRDEECVEAADDGGEDGASVPSSSTNNRGRLRGHKK